MGTFNKWIIWFFVPPRTLGLSKLIVLDTILLNTWLADTVLCQVSISKFLQLVSTEMIFSHICKMKELFQSPQAKSPSILP